ncbi:MAG: hypothetical protein N838_05520 [Thiohalocapsa sp. PB-PSB1]|nr:MAG: hypothetical protein N838_05520 [Thiohalocapsa sp. PB-PSB1]
MINDQDSSRYRQTQGDTEQRHDSLQPMLAQPSPGKQ